MLQIRLTAKGVFAFAKRPKSTRDRQFISVVKHFQKEALSDYATGKMRPNLRGRGDASAFGIYGFKPRSNKYQKQQRRVLGVVRPYYSPRRANFAALATEVTRAASGRGNAIRLLRAVQGLYNNSRPHMIDLITRPIIGHTIHQTGRMNLRTSLRLPGARILNRGGAKNEVYKNQLLNLNMGGGRDKRAIIARFQNKVRDWMPLFFKSQVPARLRTTA